MQQKLKKKLPHGKTALSEQFLLNNDFSQKAFANLSKNRNTVKKEDLLDETKRLMKEHLMEQIRENQIKSRKFQFKKN